MRHLVSSASGPYKFCIFNLQKTELTRTGICLFVFVQFRVRVRVRVRFALLEFVLELQLELHFQSSF